MNKTNSLQENWIEKEKAKLSPSKGRRGKRQYLHFDRRIQNLSDEVVSAICNPNEVARHAFLPFIRFIKRTKRYKRIKGTRKSRRTTKERPIDYAAHFDALIYSWYAEILSHEYENIIVGTPLNSSVLAYRSLGGKNNIHFAYEVFEFIKMHPDYVVAAFDIENFYGTIDHGLLREAWRNLLKGKIPDDHYQVYKSLTRYRWVRVENLRRLFNFGFKGAPFKERVCSPKEFREKVARGGLLSAPPSGAGIPQGSSVSCVLSNIYMFTFDQVIQKEIELHKGFYRRYSDDIIIAIPAEKVDVFIKLIEHTAAERKLKLNSEKTELRRFAKKDGRLIATDWVKNVETSLQYLGLEYDGEDIRLRHAGLARAQRRMVQGVRRALWWAQKNKKPMPANFLLTRFTRAGKRQKKENYLTYADRASKLTGSKAISKQTSEQKFAKRLKRKIETSQENNT